MSLAWWAQKKGTKSSQVSSINNNLSREQLTDRQNTLAWLDRLHQISCLDYLILTFYIFYGSQLAYLFQRHSCLKCFLQKMKNMERKNTGRCH